MKKLLVTAMLPLALSAAGWAQADDDDATVVICHKQTETLEVGMNAARVHANLHGDTAGRCEDDDRPRVSTVVLMRCDNDDSGAIVVDSISVAHGSEVVNPLDEMPEGYNCAQALRRLYNAGFEVQNTSSGGGGSGLRVEYLLGR